MAAVQVVYTWPEGGTLSVLVRAKVRNPEALADMRIEAKRLWHEALMEMRADEVRAVEAPEG